MTRGQIPARKELHGTLFRNGPGLLDVNGHHIHHPFDGDGMINAIAFRDGRAYFRNRFIRTTAYLEELANSVPWRFLALKSPVVGWPNTVTSNSKYCPTLTSSTGVVALALCGKPPDPIV